MTPGLLVHLVHGVDLPRNAHGRTLKQELRDRGPSSGAWDRDRSGFRVTSDRLVVEKGEGRCPQCSTIIPGVWDGQAALRAFSEGNEPMNCTAQNEDKDLRTLTFFFTAAYTRPGAEMLANERRTRGQERRDGL